MKERLCKHPGRKELGENKRLEEAMMAGAERARVGMVEDVVRNERKNQNMQSWTRYIKKGYFYCGNKRKV